MEYGFNILSKQPADWQVTNGTITGTGIALNASGKASIELFTKDLKTVPDTMKLHILAEPFADVYAPTAYASLRVLAEDNSVRTYTVPIIETVHGACSVVIPTVKSSYKTLTFCITSAYPINILDWSLSAPIAEESDVDIESVKEEIPKLLADYNTSTFTVGQREENIALISARLIENTDVSGHLQLTYVASADCVITLRLKDNDGTELFAPILYEVKKGRGSIGVPHAYLKRLLGMHTFTVTAQCSTGTLTFYTRSIMYTVDAGYLATRTMDVGLDLRDIAVCQLPGDDKPSSIYAVGIDDDGIARVRYRTYSDNAAIVWEPAFSLTEAKQAAIEFDGDFVRRTGDDYYTLECRSQPTVFWTDTSDNLYVQVGPEESTRQLLASNVSALAAVRGFKSQLYQEQDQGLIVAYVVDGLVYYRNYCRQADGSYTWEYEKQISQLGTGVVNIQVHRLNDYRVGFVASGPNGHVWVISGRTYIGAASPAEHVDMRTDSAGSMAIYRTSDTTPTVSVEGDVSDDFLTMTIRSVLPLVINDTFDDTFYASSASTTSISVKSIAVVDGAVRITLHSRPKNGILYLTPKPNRFRAHYVNRGYIPLFSDIRFEFGDKIAVRELVDMHTRMSCTLTQKAVLPLPITAPAEYISMNVSATCVLSQKAITTKDMSFSETISMNASMTCNMTQVHVGTSPV